MTKEEYESAIAALVGSTLQSLELRRLYLEDAIRTLKAEHRTAIKSLKEELAGVNESIREALDELRRKEEGGPATHDSEA